MNSLGSPAIVTVFLDFTADFPRHCAKILRLGNLIASRAVYDFYRPVPSGGYSQGLPAAERPDVGETDIPPEKLREDFWPYYPSHLCGDPANPTPSKVELARAKIAEYQAIFDTH